MKRSRFGARDRLSGDAAELQRLAAGLAASGSRLEDMFWENRLFLQVRNLLEAGRDGEIEAALDRLYESNTLAFEGLIDVVEAQSETCVLDVKNTHYDVLLFTAPLLAWSRYAIPGGGIGQATLAPLKVQLGAHVFSQNARLALADYLFSPDQLPQGYSAIRKFLQALCKEAMRGGDLRIDVNAQPETHAFLSDVRYLIGVAVVPRGEAVFRWNEPDGKQSAALSAWERQGGSNLAPIMTGCSYQLLLPNAFFHATRHADQESRGYSLKASIAFLQTTLGLMPEELRAVIAPCYEERLEEYRVGFAPRDHEGGVFQGVVWPLFGGEGEEESGGAQIEELLRQCGVKEIVTLDHRMPMEFCDDCGVPFFPTADGELVHAEMPENADSAPQTLH
ncbi:MAG: DUF2863 family protein [Zoogloeaceae bacterium]|jgi:hypothetical protein|nr:DUF2863 family protein [Zoogloeaceae bacterium]